MATNREKADEEVILANLAAPSAIRPNDDLRNIRRNLGKRGRPLVTREQSEANKRYARVFLPRSRKATADDFKQAAEFALRWRLARIDVDTADAWLRAGAHPHDQYLVALLLQEGISAEGSSVEVEHPNSGERLTILEFARKATASFGEFENLGEALDSAKVDRTPLRKTGLSRRDASG